MKKTFFYLSLSMIFIEDAMSVSAVKEIWRGDWWSNASTDSTSAEKSIWEDDVEFPWINNNGQNPNTPAQVVLQVNPNNPIAPGSRGLWNNNLHKVPNNTPRNSEIESSESSESSISENNGKERYITSNDPRPPSYVDYKKMSGRPNSYGHTVNIPNNISGYKTFVNKLAQKLEKELGVEDLLIHQNLVKAYKNVFAEDQSKTMDWNWNDNFKKFKEVQKEFLKTVEENKVLHDSLKSLPFFYKTLTRAHQEDDAWQKKFSSVERQLGAAEDGTLYLLMKLANKVFDNEIKENV